MNIIEELIKKHQGEYCEDSEKASTMLSGRYTFQPQRGIITLDGTKISININEVGGASQSTEPYRLVLYLSKDYKTRLEIFPKTNLMRFLEFFAPKIPTNSELVNKQFSFNGDNGLIGILGADSTFCTKIKNEKVFILIGEKYPKHIILTPAHGIDDIEHLEKLLSLLKMIEEKIKGNIT